MERPKEYERAVPVNLTTQQLPVPLAGKAGNREGALLLLSARRDDACFATIGSLDRSTARSTQGL